MTIDTIEIQVRGPQGIQGLPGPAGPAGSAYYGQASRMTAGTITVASQGAYQATGLAATFDSSAASGVALGTVNTFALRNTSGVAKVFRVYGSMDAKGSNNEILGIKLAKNGTPIDATECRAFGGNSQQEAKLVTSWMVSLSPNDEISLFVANHSSSHEIAFGRGRILMSSVG